MITRQKWIPLVQVCCARHQTTNTQWDFVCITLVTKSRMYSNKPVRCFQHCDNRNILCFDVPSKCPLCGASLPSPMRVPPFRITSPFSHSTDAANAFVVCPAEGSYSDCELSLDDLHVGITDSKGIVYHYNDNGINIDDHGWTEVISVRFPSADVQPQHWDSILLELAKQSKWTAEQYNEATNNCFTFALNFLARAGVIKTQPQLMTATEFCHQYVMQVLDKASNYIKLVKTISKEGCLIQDATWTIVHSWPTERHRRNKR